jgi:predicted patatin/cPLA2 family phospholipase
MILEGDKSVIEALKEKKRLLSSGQSHEHLKILCICNGGLIKGAYSVGVGLALEELGYTDVFDDFVGISSGAASAAYFVGGNVNEGGSLIYDECCSKSFLNLKKFWNVINYDFLEDVLEGKTNKALRFEKIFSSPTSLYIGIADFETGAPLLVSPKNKNDLLAAIRASAFMPHLSKEVAYVSSRQCMDGGFASPHIIEKILTDIDFTHVLILTSQNHKEKNIPWHEHFLCATIFRYRFSKSGLKSALERKQSLKKALELVMKQENKKCSN